MMMTPMMEVPMPKTTDNSLSRLRARPAATACSAKRMAAGIASVVILLMANPALANPALANPALANPAAKDIKAYFASVPTEVFDATTDGLDEDQRKTLLAKGRSDDWIFKRVHAGKAILTATHPSSIVTMTLMKFTGPVMQVHIQNERAETISYWAYANQSGQLLKQIPPLVLQAAAAAHHDIHGDSTKGAGGLIDPLAGMPSAIISHVNALDICAKPAGADSAKMPAQAGAIPALRQSDLRCNERPAIEAELRRKHNAPITIAMLDRAKALLGQ
jgi:hypothetical protein